MVDAGFQLSLSAVIGIMVALLLIDPYVARMKTPLLFQVVAVTVGATLFTWPISIYTFGTFSLLGLFANVIVLPLLSLLYVLLLLAVVFSLIVSFLGLPFAFMAHVVWLLISMLTTWLSQLPWGYWEDIHIPIWSVILSYIFFIGLATVILSKQRRTWREIWV
jgi:competence protein ComEC